LGGGARAVLLCYVTAVCYGRTFSFNVLHPACTCQPATPPPSSVFCEKSPCNEHSGAGWEATAVSASNLTALVRFVYATTAEGAKYEDVRLPLQVLHSFD